MGSQRVGHDLVTEKQEEKAKSLHDKKSKTITCILEKSINLVDSVDR